MRGLFPAAREREIALHLAFTGEAGKRRLNYCVPDVAAAGCFGKGVSQTARQREFADIASAGRFNVRPGYVALAGFARSG